MKYQNIVENILGQRSKVRILRYLCTVKPSASVGEICRAIRVTPANTSIALKELAQDGVLTAKPVGRSVLYALDKEHATVKHLFLPLFAKEKDFKKLMLSRIIKGIGHKFHSVILFGSIQKGTERTDSDIDLAIIVDERADKAKVEDAVNDLMPAIAREYGNVIAPVVYSRREFIKKYNDNEGLARSIASGEVVAGKLVSELLWLK